MFFLSSNMTDNITLIIEIIENFFSEIDYWHIYLKERKRSSVEIKMIKVK